MPARTVLAVGKIISLAVYMSCSCQALDWAVSKDGMR